MWSTPICFSAVGLVWAIVTRCSQTLVKPSRVTDLTQVWVTILGCCLTFPPLVLLGNFTFYQKHGAEKACASTSNFLQKPVCYWPRNKELESRCFMWRSIFNQCDLLLMLLRALWSEFRTLSLFLNVESSCVRTTGFLFNIFQSSLAISGIFQ